MENVAHGEDVVLGSEGEYKDRVSTRYSVLGNREESFLNKTRIV
jgi:hypothetical protein